MREHKEENTKKMWQRLVERFTKRFRRKGQKGPFSRPPENEEASAAAVTTSSSLPVQAEPVLVLSPVQKEQNASQKGLWATAADSLDPGDRENVQNLLRSNEQLPKCHARDSLADEVNSTLAKAESLREEDEEATWKPIVTRIIKVALAFKSLGDAAVAFDKSGYAALGWSVVSFGLQVAANADETREFVLSSSEIITRFMAKYREYERVFRCLEAGEEFDRLLTNVYKALLLYMVALDTFLRQSGLVRVAHSIDKLEDQPINLTKKAIDTADAEVRDWLLIIMHKRNDDNFCRIRRMLQGRELPEVPDMAQECLKSLVFEEMEDRFHDIERATAGTCKWLLRHEKYRDWTNADRGVLCIKGKPGSGKSTLLHYAVGDAFVASKVPDRTLIQHNENEATGERAEPRILILSFFFHDRGTNLQKTPLGLYRSLLHQVLRCVPGAIPDALLTTFQDRNKMGEVGKHWHWKWRELREYFQLSLRTVLNTHQVCLFIDAFDEYGEEEANEFLNSLNFWIQELPTHAQFRICFTCRHYPPLVLPQTTVEIRLDEENMDDISTYVQVQLSSWSKDEYLASILTDITDRAEGVFVWARLIVPRVLSLERRGENWKKIKREIENTPRAVEDLYRSLLRKVETDPNSLKLIKWICFAMEPLTLDELRWAMVVDHDHSNEPASLDHYEKTEDFATNSDMMEKKLKALSCGLAEAVPSSRAVQFIHQSVKDFFLKEGLSTLAKSQDPTMTKTHTIDLEATSHYQMSRTCIRYFSAKEIRASESPSLEVKGVFPLLLYAINHWIAHEQQSEKKVAHPQSDLLIYFEWPSEDIVEHWVNTCHVLRMYSDILPPRGTTMLHVTARHRLMGPLLQIVQRKKELTENFDAFDSDRKTPLYYAAGEGHANVVSLLLDNGATMYGKEPTYLNALFAASRSGHYRIAQILLEKGADVNASTGFYGTALHEASSYGHKEVVRLLLENNADVKAEGGHSRTALQAASLGGHEEIARLLLEKGADISAGGGHFGNPLQAASRDGREGTVRLLLEKGADIDAWDGDHSTALQLALRGGHEGTVRLLLEKGADPNIGDGDYGTALQEALDCGHEELAQLLLKHGAAVTARN